MNNRIRSNHVQLGKSLTLNHEKFYGELSEEGQKSKDPSPEELMEQERKNQVKEAQKAFEKTIQEAQSQGKTIIEEAEKKAAEIIKKAEEEAQNQAVEIENQKQQSIENGYAEGFQKGYDEGIEQAKQEIADKIENINTITSAVFRVKKEIINSAEKEIIELSTVIAEKILRQQLELKPGLMEEIIKSAIDQLSEKQQIKIIVNPALTNNLYGFIEGLKDKIRGLESIKLAEDRTIPVDGVIVESPDSRIDGRIEAQLAEIIKNLMLEFSEKSNAEDIPEEIEVRINDALAESENPKDNEN